MKLFVLVLFIVCAVAGAQNKNPDLERSPASERTSKANNTVMKVLQGAIDESDRDLKMSKAAIATKEEGRSLKSLENSKQQIIIQGTSAVDQTTTNGLEK